MTADEQRDYRQRHLRHRLTLLRSYSHRRATGFDWNGNGDLFRCAKDSALIAIRLFLSAMGLKGRKDQDFDLYQDRAGGQDDVLIDQLGGTLPDPSSWSLTPPQARLLAGIYCRTNKELAHLTSTFDDEFNGDEIVDEAAQLVVGLLNTNLYTVVNETMPEIDL